MILEHVLAVLRFIVGPIISAVKKEKAPVAIVPSSSALAVNSFDSEDFAIICLCLGIALVFSTLAVLSLAATRR